MTPGEWPTIIITDYTSKEREIRHIREQVFIVEQHIAREDEYDERDLDCVHVLAMDGDQIIGTGRIDLAKQGKIGRLAVLKKYRRRGVGARLMQAIEDLALDRKVARVWFHAQRSAVPLLPGSRLRDC